MDFKVAGTSNGITGFQLDLKINGLPFEIAKTAMEGGARGPQIATAIQQARIAALGARVSATPPGPPRPG